MICDGKRRHIDRPFCFFSWQIALETRLWEAARHVRLKFTYKLSWRLNLPEVYIGLYRFCMYFRIIVAPFRLFPTHQSHKEGTLWIILWSRTGFDPENAFTRKWFLSMSSLTIHGESFFLCVRWAVLHPFLYSLLKYLCPS